MFMYDRTAIKSLESWKAKPNRKPLILRGARQVGKTTLINIFSKKFDVYIKLNLEKKEDRDIFTGEKDLKTILQLIFLRLGRVPVKKERVLLFIDEIQNSPQAVNLLRYFYEEAADIFVIATGSLLETLLDKKVTFPVGRVEYLFLYPFSFEEFLMARDNSVAMQAYYSTPVPDFAHITLLKLFKEYMLIGGMPEIVKVYMKTEQIALLNPVFDSLLIAYQDDVEKYAQTDKQANILRHIIQNAFIMAGKRIKFEGFASSNYKSADVSDCFRMLEKTFLLKLIYPTTQAGLPLQINKKKAPRLQVLDTGIINRVAGIQTQILGNNNIEQVNSGLIVEHLVGQQLIASLESPLSQVSFWVREKKQSNAEVDFIIQKDDLLIPVEVKSGSTGRLRSLMEFMDIAPHYFAVRIYQGALEIHEVKTINGKHFKLLNLPFYLSGRIFDYLDWFIRKNS